LSNCSDEITEISSTGTDIDTRGLGGNVEWGSKHCASCDCVARDGHGAAEQVKWACVSSGELGGLGLAAAPSLWLENT
jgi:hypothetical protein